MTTPETSSRPGIVNVIERNMCVGCGACGVATGGRIPVTIRPRGYYEADIAGASPADLATASRVCPFTNESEDEDTVAHRLFPDLPKDGRIGHHRSLFAGRVADDGEIPFSSSGGLTSWTASRLLERGLIDGVIHVGNVEQPMFGYVVSTTIGELRDGRKSKYYPATFDEVLRGIRGDGRRYAFIGIPCAVKALRHVTEQDSTLRDQIAFCLGIVCGHLKTMAYPESFAWQLGIAPDELETVDFRIKDPSLTSRQYKFGARAKGSDRFEEAQTLSLVGGSWGHAVFQLNACNYCDDVFAETADVVFGDAWLSKYEIDWRGTNVVVTRNEVIDEILRAGAQVGQITLEELDPDSVAKTQAGNYRHRRDGLAVRLADDDADGSWRPDKRVKPGYDHVSEERVGLIRNRRNLSEVSQTAFADAKEARDLNVYLNAIKPLIDSYQSQTKMTFVTRVRNKIQRESWKLIRKVSNR
ncbi:Coenzyme F420 hydrogenase/dehydrogenase, beta subunit C-terminal domain [Microbacterium sp. VKM Ac-2923]|uniref:Coenzyme F420 hydrogenase/dehydrogenase, beta subunit C-terminal domain n=1 Tax=Microbacterium sp. VKM Ac-2923 TaxID=2929476 RepID=UPI001FB33B80|nr:Coenzyme F420 hydrogenase/dehydrogenase, beta subunit C-terminal domain [Microbacterium sp. VKM Ac-2923]MCJ1706814.1 Coenzyme F420 hydrogenase/dehydrogenase, beta subunit C-terminal domain [Microbacterium sp. VKM Ac-2923]